jgi:hypothetical protein
MKSYLQKLLAFSLILATVILIRGLISWNLDLSTWDSDQRSSALVGAIVIYAIFGRALFDEDEK